MRQLLQRFLQPKREDSTPAQAVIVVSGLPRSGTSMMMKMLEAGGLEAVTDELRTADKDNPQGYYEFEPVKQLDKGNSAWLSDANGKVVKVISALLKHLPSIHTYRVIFMHRRMEEILASQRKMLVHRNEATDKVSDEQLTQLFTQHLQTVNTWLRTQPQIQVLEVDYNELLQQPLPHIERIVAFLSQPLDKEQMIAVVDPVLYRNRVQ